MEKSSDKPTPEVNPTLAKNEGAQRRENNFNYISVIRSLNFLTNSTRPEAQFMVHQCAQLITDPKLPHNQSVKCIMNYFMGADMRGLIMKPEPEIGIECYVDNNFSSGCNQE